MNTIPAQTKTYKNPTTNSSAKPQLHGMILNSDIRVRFTAVAIYRMLFFFLILKFKNVKASAEASFQEALCP